MRRPAILVFPAVSLFLIQSPAGAFSGTQASAISGQPPAKIESSQDLQRREQRLKKLQRRYDKQLDECQEGNRRACDQALNTYAQMQQVKPRPDSEPEVR